MNPKIFQALSIAKGLEVYADHEIKVNRLWTPKAMMAKASEMTGLTFKARDYRVAARALRALIK